MSSKGQQFAVLKISEERGSPLRMAISFCIAPNSACVPPFPPGWRPLGPFPEIDLVAVHQRFQVLREIIGEAVIVEVADGGLRCRSAGMPPKDRIHAVQAAKSPVRCRLDQGLIAASSAVQPQ